MTFTERLNGLLADKSRSNGFSGAILVKQGEKELFSAAYGYANRSWGTKNQVDTRFRVASVSKMFTAVALLQLVEAGKLELRTRAVGYLGLENTTIPKEVTVYHLLTMTSGLADWFDESGDWEANWAALRREHPLYELRRHEDYLPLFVNKPPAAKVGEGHRYNNAGYILLGLMIEKAAGMSYFDYVRRHVFEKAQMTRSGFVALEAVDAEVAEGYVPVTDNDAVTGWRKNIYSATPEGAADGGATSTVDDMSRFAGALRGGQLLSPEMTQEMLAPKVLEDDEPFRGYTWKYGYGLFFLLDERDQVVRWGHTGEEDGVSCRFYHYPEQDVGVVILGNQSGCSGALAWEIHDLVLEAS